MTKSIEKPFFSVIIGYRDRDVDRVRRCLNSLFQQTGCSFEIIFIDYGSRRNWAEKVREVIAEFPDVRFFRTETQGHPWNRSKALNIGLRQAKGRFVATTDIDLIFPPLFLETIHSQVTADRAIQCPPFLLPEGFSDWDTLTGASSVFPIGDNYLGAFQCVERDRAIQVGGFNENYEFWGLEDQDFQLRLENIGAKPKLACGIRAFHQWHPTTQRDIPLHFLTKLSQTHFDAAKRGTIEANSGKEWGKLVSRQERAFLIAQPNWEEFLFLSFQISRALLHQSPGKKLLISEKITTPNGFSSLLIPRSPFCGLAQDYETLLENSLNQAFSERNQNCFDFIMLSISNRYRMNFAVFSFIYSLLKPNGLLLVENLEITKKNTLSHFIKMELFHFFEILFPRIWRISPTAQDKCREYQALLKNNLRDSLLSVRHGNVLFRDYYLDCLYPEGRRAVFIK
jgi:glycosyltransferase involved in cell wall biosynthesis